MECPNKGSDSTARGWRNSVWQLRVQTICLARETSVVYTSPSRKNLNLLQSVLLLVSRLVAPGENAVALCLPSRLASISTSELFVEQGELIFTFANGDQPEARSNLWTHTIFDQHDLNVGVHTQFTKSLRHCCVSMCALVLKSSWSTQCV